MTLDELHRIKLWHLAHRRDHPVEYHLWDAMLTLWVVGWVGWLPLLVSDNLWALPLCVAATLAPRAYVTWRARAHHARRLRCDWLLR